MLAAFFFPAFVGALLHILAHYRHVLISGIEWNHKQTQDKQNGEPLTEKQFYCVTRGQKLHSAPLIFGEINDMATTIL